MQEPFIINHSFLVTPGKNTITNRKSGEETRIEQRLLDVLYLLAATPRELVTREFIISSVWNDYGGADEGLTQSISLLRKILADQDKKIIETIPKKGYLLNATITPVDTKAAQGQEIPGENNHQKKKNLYFIIGAIAIVVIAFVIYISISTHVTEHRSTDVLPNDGQRGADTRGADVQHDTANVHSPDIVPDSLRR